MQSGYLRDLLLVAARTTSPARLSTIRPGGGLVVQRFSEQGGLATASSSSAVRETRS